MFPGPTTIRLSSSPPISERARVLLVEADDAHRAELEAILTAEGYETLALDSADEVLRLVAEYDPDLVLMDLVLPGTTGAEVCGEMKAYEPRRNYPVVLLSYDALDDMTIAGGLLAGADDFITDPRRGMEFRARIRVQLRNKRHMDALQRLRLERDSLRRDAQVDGLTGVMNRRSLESEVISRCERRERFGALFIDVDLFKTINDQFGHEMGDRVLISLAEVLRAGIRPGDAVARYGGEEFVVLVAGAGPESARLVAERLRKSVETLVPPSGGPERVAVSIGTAVFDPRSEDQSWDELLRRADAALYAAKRGGRNRVVMFSPECLTGLSTQPGVYISSLRPMAGRIGRLRPG
jgi:two-component system, cell cycle response regulator